MGKTRELFKKIGDTKGIFLAKVDMMNNRNGMDLKEAEDMKKRWQEYRVPPEQEGLAPSNFCL